MSYKVRKYSSKKQKSKGKGKVAGKIRSIRKSTKNSKNKQKKSSKNRVQKMYVIVYNINYYDKDGNIILDNKKKKDKVLKNYKYEQGTSGSYGFYHEYIIPSGKTNNFDSDIKSFYENLGIKNLKITTSLNKKEMDSKLDLLDKEPN
jgi:hypothetical protein